MDRESALESSEDKDSDKDEQSENSRSNENSSTGKLYTIQSAQSEATNRLYPKAGEIIKNTTKELRLKRTTILKAKLPEISSTGWVEQGEEAAEEFTKLIIIIQSLGKDIEILSWRNNANAITHKTEMEKFPKTKKRPIEFCQLGMESTRKVPLYLILSCA